VFWPCRSLGDGERVQSVVKLMLGIALLMASSAIVVKAYMQMRATAGIALSERHTRSVRLLLLYASGHCRLCSSELSAASSSG
jgi:hypothetical protein